MLHLYGTNTLQTGRTFYIYIDYIPLDLCYCLTQIRTTVAKGYSGKKYTHVSTHANTGPGTSSS